MRISIDIDGVVADSATLMRKKALESGVDLVFNKYNPDVIGVDDSEKFIGDIIIDIFTNHMMEVQPYKEAIYTLPTIRKYLGDITFITARYRKFNDATIMWLQHHFHIPWSFINKPSAEKAQFVFNSGFDVFIEDRLRTANQAAELGVRTYLINRPWNVGRFTHENVIRINSLTGFYSIEVARNDG